MSPVFVVSTFFHFYLTISLLCNPLVTTRLFLIFRALLNMIVFLVCLLKTLWLTSHSSGCRNSKQNNYILEHDHFFGILLILVDGLATFSILI